MLWILTYNNIVRIKLLNPRNIGEGLLHKFIEKVSYQLLQKMGSVRINIRFAQKELKDSQHELSVRVAKHREVWLHSFPI